MRTRWSGLLVAACVLAGVGSLGDVGAQPGTVERVDISGLREMSSESLLEALGVRPGDPYDEAALRAGFRRLWALGLFRDVLIEAEDGPEGGKIVLVTVEERPVLKRVTYDDNKVLTQTQIIDRLRERDAILKLDRSLDMKAVYKAASVIRDHLTEKGHLDALVEAETEEVGKDAYGVHFKIRPGGKTKIRRIRFTGNEVFSNRRLRGELRLTKPRRWYWPWTAKNLYHPVKWDQDVGALRDLYQNYGYLDVAIRPPVVDIVKRKGPKKDVAPKRMRKVLKAQRRFDAASAAHDRIKAESPPDGLEGRRLDRWREKRAKRMIEARRAENKAEEALQAAQRKAEPASKSWVALTVPVSEGPQYSTGEITLEGNSVFEEVQLRSLIPLREGAVLSNAVLQSGLDRITAIYGERGYLYADVSRQLVRREEETIADVRVTIDEDSPYHVGTIEFAGNTATQDRVLRREVRINEGDLFSRRRMDLSVAKVNQLGYFELTEEPIIEPIEGEQRVRVTMRGQEKGRNEIQIGGGYSGLDGAFFQGFYSTRNFLGRGQILATSLQIGGRANRYSVSFIEPWFLARPITLGFSLFRRDVDFGNYLTTSGKGGGIVIGRQIGVFTDVRVNYNYESVTSSGIALLTTGDPLAPGTALTGVEERNRISSITPGFTYDRVNNPFRPSRGWSIQVQTQVAGGPVGGDTNFFRPVVRYSGFKKAFRGFFLAFHAEAGLIRSFAEGTQNTATVEGIPRFQRFWLGGDVLGPRVFDTRTVTPLRFAVVDDLGQVVGWIRDPTGLPLARRDPFTGAQFGGVIDRDGNRVLDAIDLVELGGDRFLLLQNELVYRINEQFDLAFFVDLGNSLFEDTSFGLDDLRASAGLEFRFYLPVFPVPLRLIYGVPIRKLQLDETSNFTFSLGRSF